MNLLEKAFSDDTVQLDLHAADLPAILHKTLEHLAERGRLNREHLATIEEGLIAREREAPTVIGHAVAIPHFYLDDVAEPIVAFVRLKAAVDLGAPDGRPTRFLFVLLGPREHIDHLDTLTNIARLMSDDEFRYDAAEAKNADDLRRALDEFLGRTSPEPAAPTDKTPHSLQRTGRLFGGVLEDIRRRLPHYRSDFTDGLHSKALSSTLFLFFACLAPAVTFGGIMSQMTGQHIGVVEMIIASSICGVIYALFAGMPLIILGGTGPLLVFTAILYELCEKLQIPFLETYAWIGLWTALLMIILAATDASYLMRYFTRFTDEIFAALISLIFIFSAVQKIAAEFDGLKETHRHDTALLTLLLALGTLYIATSLSAFRRSRFLFPKLREFFADFGPTIALVCMALVAIWLSDVELRKLLPDHYNSIVPTHTLESGEPRPWLIDLTAVPLWVRFAALGPAALVSVLIYIDQNITARLVNSPDHKLQKGEAYHYDLAIVGSLIAFCSVFGFPWLVAATVRSLNHVRSLATSEKVTSRGGDQHDRIIHTRETRLTSLSIHVLVGVSLLALPLLKLIPMAVLYGLFLYMGIVSMSGNQFFERLSLWATDANLFPRTHYIRKVPVSTIHRFTAIQMLCLVVLGIIEVTPLAILFPLFLVLLVPTRIFMNRHFSPEHLAALDAEEEPDDEEIQWAA